MVRAARLARGGPEDPFWVPDRHLVISYLEAPLGDYISLPAAARSFPATAVARAGKDRGRREDWQDRADRPVLQVRVDRRELRDRREPARPARPSRPGGAGADREAGREYEARARPTAIAEDWDIRRAQAVVAIALFGRCESARKLA